MSQTRTKRTRDARAATRQRADTAPRIRDRITGLVRVRASELLPHPENWRRHSVSQRTALRGLLEDVGFAGVVLTFQTPKGLMIIDGHARGEEMGDEIVPALTTDLTEAEARKVLATYDPIAALAETDGAALRALLGQVSSENEAVRAMLASLGKDATSAIGPRQGKTDPDAVPPLEEQAVSQLGDLWLLGDHRLLCGDSTREECVRQLMGGQQAQVVFTDPPYGVAYKGGAKRRDRLQGDEVGTGIYAAALPMLRFAADDKAPLYLWYADGHAAAAAAAAAAAGYQIVAQIIWAKNHAQFVTAAHYKGKHEPCYYGHRRGHAARWHGPNNEVTLWEYERSSRNEFHPTQKPVALALRALRNSSAQADIVLDLFGGSGSTLIAAEQLERRCYANELEPKYVDVIVRRWQTFTGREATLDGTGQTFAAVERERAHPQKGRRTA